MNKRLFIARVLSFIPEQLSVFFYRRLADYGISIFKKNKVSIWPRNSLVLNRIEPFLSDIDMSIFFDAYVNDLDKEKILRRYRWLRKLIPIFGELNVYSAEDREIILRNINKYELLRDPRLCQKLQIADDQKENLAEKIAFLFRMFHSDWRSLQDYPKFREKKWMGHFLDLGLKPPSEVNFQVIQKSILDLVPLDDRERIRLQGQLNSFYELLAVGNRDWTIPELMKERDLIWAFYPHFFCYQNGGFARENSFLMQVCQAQIKWEIFGCLTQHLVFDRRINLQKHIARLIYYCEQIGLDSSIREDLDLVLKKIRDKLVFEQNDEEIKAIIAQRPVILLEGKLQKIILFLKDKGPQKILEIGSFAGGSAFVLARSFPSANIVSVDKNNFNEYFRHLDHHEKIFNYVTTLWPEIRWEYDSMLQTQKMYESMVSNLKFQNVKDHFYIQGPFDVVIVDGDHSPEALWNDLQLAYENIKSGYIFVDDSSYQHIRETSEKFCSQHNLKWEGVWWERIKAEDMMIIEVNKRTDLEE